MPIYVMSLVLAMGVLLGQALMCVGFDRYSRFRLSMRVFALLCGAILVVIACRVLGYLSTAPARLLQWESWMHASSWVACGLVPYATASLRGIQCRLYHNVIVIIGLIGAALTAVLPGSWMHTAIVDVATTELPWGEIINQGVGPMAWYAIFPVIFAFLAAGQMAFAAWKIMGKGSFLVRAFAIGGALILAVSLSCHVAKLMGHYEGVLFGEWAGIAIMSAFAAYLANQLAQSEVEQKQINNAIADAIVVHDANSGAILDCNSSALALFARPWDDFQRLRVAELLTPETAISDHELKAWFGKAQYGSWLERSGIVLRPDGSRRHAEARIQRTIIAGRDSIIATIRDVSDRVAAEARAEKAHQRMYDFVERAPIAVGISHADGGVEYLNQRFTDMFGWKMGEVSSIEEAFRMGQPDDVDREREKARFAEEVAAATAGDQTVGPYECDVTTLSGKKITVLMAGVIIDDRQVMFFNDVTALKSVQAQLVEQAHFNQQMLDSITDGISVSQSTDSPQLAYFSVWNRGLEAMLGYSQEEINRLGWFNVIYPSDEVKNLSLQRMAAIHEGNHLHGEEWQFRHKSGSIRIVSVSTAHLPSRPNEPRRVVSIMRDVTSLRNTEREHRHLEAQVQHAQKLESLGVLAGGIAHDFNNILMSVLGRASLLGSILPIGHESRPHLLEIENAAQRAAELCRQMLAYAGKGRFVVEPVSLETSILEMARMLEVSISKKVVLKYDFADGLPFIKADANQIRQVVMNLITNASEAVGERSGVITIRTGAMDCDVDYLRETYLDDDLEPGLYVYAEVADTGCGMDRETQQRLFEPFFTTKFTGRGLGLAAVLGIIRGHRGAIKVYSELKRGTTIKVLFPSIQERPLEVEPSMDGPQGIPAPCTVLVVDDEETIRALAKDMMQGLGIEVLMAEDGRAAVELYRQHQGRITCVLLDLTMPHMDGEETFRELRRINAKVRVIMSSGYNQQEVTQRFVGKGLAGFLQKPYSLAALRTALVDVMKS